MDTWPLRDMSSAKPWSAHGRSQGFGLYPKGPGTQIVYTLVPKYLYREYFKAKVYLFGYMDP